MAREKNSIVEYRAGDRLVETLTPNEKRAIQAIYETRVTYPSRLGRRLGSSRQYATRLLADLAEKDLVKEIEGAEEHKKYFEITEQGSAASQALLAVSQGIMRFVDIYDYLHTKLLNWSGDPKSFVDVVVRESAIKRPDVEFVLRVGLEYHGFSPRIENGRTVLYRYDMYDWLVQQLGSVKYVGEEIGGTSMLGGDLSSRWERQALYLKRRDTEGKEKIRRMVVEKRWSYDEPPTLGWKWIRGSEDHRSKPVRLRDPDSWGYPKREVVLVSPEPQLIGQTRRWPEWKL